MFIQNNPPYHYIHSSSFLVQFNLPTTLIPHSTQILLFPLILLLAIQFFGIAPSVLRFHRKKISTSNKKYTKLSWKFIIFSNYSIKLFVSFLFFFLCFLLLLCCINPLSNKELMEILNPKKKGNSFCYGSKTPSSLN